MSRVNEITREKWILSVFPEWGTWLNEEIDAEEVPAGQVAMWWLGCTGIWIKTEKGTNILLICGLAAEREPRKQGDGQIPSNAQHDRRADDPAHLRAAPVVYDPFAVTQVDAVCPLITITTTLIRLQQPCLRTAR